MENPTQDEMQQLHQPPGRRIAAVSQISEMPEYAWLSENALRHIIFTATPRYNSRGEKLPTNGLDRYGAVIRIGRKVLIDLDRFDQWVDAHREEVPDA